MPTINKVDPAQATGKAKDLFAAVQKEFGKVPNAYQVLANSPATLEGFLAFAGALEGSSLSKQIRERIALVVANENDCSYCLAAHSAIAQMCGLTKEDVLNSAQAQGPDPKTTTLLAFAQAIVRDRGKLDSQDVESVRKAGFTDAEILDVMALVAINNFTNYMNHMVGTVLDFPEVEIPVANRG
jgi:uncharacterized peroxidase-related enzyme